MDSSSKKMFTPCLPKKEGWVKLIRAPDPIEGLVGGNVYLRLQYGKLSIHEAENGESAHEMVVQHSKVLDASNSNKVMVDFLESVLFFECEEADSKKGWSKVLRISVDWRLPKYYKPGEVLSSGRSQNVHVFKAKRIGTRVNVVIKEVPLKNAYDIEEETMMHWKHPNILTLLDCMYAIQCKYLVTRLIGGGNLHALMHKEGALCERKAKTIIHQLLQGLHHLHKNDTVHLNITPSNILWEESNGCLMVKIWNFDCSKKRFIERNAVDNETLDYYPPEHLGGMNYDTKRDIWACGIILYQLLTGNRPFSDRLHIRRFLKSISSAYCTKTNLKRHSTAVKDLLSRMLREDPIVRVSAIQALYHDWFHN